MYQLNVIKKNKNIKKDMIMLYYYTKNHKFHIKEVNVNIIKLKNKIKNKIKNINLRKIKVKNIKIKNKSKKYKNKKYNK